MPESLTAKDKVTAGINLLDQYWIGWRSKINPSKLNVSSYNQCPLGQISGDSSFASGLIQLQQRIENFIGPQLANYVEPKLDGCSYGFNFDNGENPKLLTELWVHELISR